MIRIRYAALALLAFAASAQAQVVPITSLPSATPLTGSEPVPAVQSGHTVKVTANQIVTLAGVTLQAKDAQLDALAALSPSANQCLYWTATTSAGLYSCTSFSRGLGVNADAGSWRSALGVAGLGGDTTYAFRSNNLSDLASASTSRTNLGVAIGTNVQAWDADLDAVAALTGTNTIYYRSASNTWSPVTIGTNLTFSGGTLAASGGGITALTGDVAASGTGSVAATLATVNSNTGACGSASASPVITLNAKGLATACTSNEIHAAGTMLLAPAAPSARWLLADGTAYSQATYPALYSAIGAQPDFTISNVAVAGASVVGVAFNGTTYVASTSAGLYSATSLSGPWTQRETHVYTATVPTWDGTNFLVVDNSATGLYYSADGITWSSTTAPGGGGYGQIYYLNGVYFFLKSSPGTDLYSSTTAGGLSGYTNRFTATVNNVAYGGGKYVAGAGTGIKYSSDGVTWSNSTIANDYGFAKNYALYIGSNTFLVFGNNGRVYKSTDGGVNFSEFRPNGVTANLTGTPHYDGTNVFYPVAGLTQWYLSSDLFATTPKVVIPQRSYYNALLTIDLRVPYYTGDRIVAGSSGGYLFILDKYSYNKATSFVVPNASTITTVSAPGLHWYIYAGP